MVISDLLQTKSYTVATFHFCMSSDKRHKNRLIFVEATEGALHCCQMAFLIQPEMHAGIQLNVKMAGMLVQS